MQLSLETLLYLSLPQLSSRAVKKKVFGVNVLKFWRAISFLTLFQFKEQKIP